LLSKKRKSFVLRHPVRVYWEDTDAGGIVYYANYLKFAERARTELLRSFGISQRELQEKQGIAIVVHRCEIDYHRSARLDDLLHIETQLQDSSKLRMTMQQRIWREEELLAEVRVCLVCIATQTGKPLAWPECLTTLLRSLKMGTEL
jgi:4-hydroxybenzoyl-CoA thioesterase/acyl-CoA thioester hydrolase